jgi:1-acyl-sn-glycerol-3-phosphate acyltransferase
MRTIVWYTHLVATLLYKAPQLLWLRAKKSKLTEEEYMEKAHKIVQKWVISQVKWSGSRFHIKGMENLPKNKPVVYVANHQSIFDIGVFLGYMPWPKGFMAKVEILKLPIIRSWMKEIKCVFLDRKDIKKSAQAIMDGVNHLKNGHSMVIFPEGTRSRGKAPNPFKGGSFKLPVRAKVPIVPVTIDGTFRACEANNYWIKPADIYVTVHPCIETNGLTLQEANTIPEMVSKIILSALPQVEAATKI